MFLNRFVIFLTMVLFGSPLVALDPSTLNNPELSQQKKQVLGALSTLVGNSDKSKDQADAKNHPPREDDEDSKNIKDSHDTQDSSSAKDPKGSADHNKNVVTVDVTDIQEAIKILENPDDRAKVIKALSALALVKQEPEPVPGVFENITNRITHTLQMSTATVLEALKISQRLPHIIQTQVFQIHTDDAYRHNTYILSVILLTALFCAIVAELLVRKLLRFYRLHRPQQRQFRKLHAHVISSITPIITFGLVGYLAIYLSQPEWNIITYRGFIFMNLAIMIRSMGLLISVLFKSHPTDGNETATEAKNTSFQFTLAGFQLIIIGIIFGEVGFRLGMGQLAVDIWLKIIGFGVTSLIIIGLIKNKDYIKNLFVADDENLSDLALFIAKLVEIFFRKAHVIFSILVALAFVFWMLNLNIIALFIIKALIVTAILSGIFILGRNWIFRVITKAKLKMQMQTDTHAKVGLSYLEGSTTNISQAIWHMLFILLLLQIWGANPIKLVTTPTVQPILSKIISILIILIVIRTLWGWIDHVAQSHIRGRIIGKKLVESSQFAKTVTPILKSVAHWILTLTAIILILAEFGQDVRPMLYSLGVIGIAISLGAQSLVKDIINGILTLMEGNIAVGEVVTIGANTGTVESLSLRSLVLRHGNGAIQSIPFSEVTNIINKSRGYSSFGVNLSVPHKKDISQAQALLDQAFQDISQDPVLGSMILDPLTITGIDQITDTGINITGSIKIKPDPGNRFGKAFNIYLQKHMEAAGFYPPASQKIINVNQPDDS